MTAPDWAAVGATVLVESSFGHYTLAIVERHTPTQIILSNGARYNAGTLRRVGHSWGSIADPARHPERVTSAAVRELASLIGRTKLSSHLLSADEVRAAVQEVHDAAAVALARLDKIQ